MGVSGNAGNDIFNVGSLNNTLDQIGSVVVGDSGGGFDQLNINDQGNLTPSNYNISDFEVNRATPRFSIGYGYNNVPLENLTFNAGQGGNNITLYSLHPNTPVNLNSGSGNDHIVMLPGVMSGFMKLDGQGGTDSLDYSAFATDVRVVLPLGLATGVTGGISNIENATGGDGNDVLVGGAGVNMLTGNSGRDVLIGGLDIDSLVAGDDDDIPIGGTTDFDTNLVALDKIKAEWTQPIVTYAGRVSNLSSGGGLNGPYLLNSVTVHDDGVTDALAGVGGLDWFLASLADTTDWDSAIGEQIVLL